MKALVLSSGGVDSTTCIAMAVKEHGAENVATVTIFYGQRLAREIESARKIAEYYKVGHYEFDLSEIFKYSNCTLIATSSKQVEEKSYEEQYDPNGIISSYVPFRNGLMLSVCATLAQSLYPDEECYVYLGNHASDFAYADCSPEFVEKMNAAINEGTYGRVSFISPLFSMTKAEVVKHGLVLNVPYNLTYSCYNGKEKPCHKCGSCIEREKAFELNGTHDPLLDE